MFVFVIVYIFGDNEKIFSVLERRSGFRINIKNEEFGFVERNIRG